MYQLTLITHFTRSQPKKQPIEKTQKFSLCISHKIVISLPVAIFFNEIMHLYSQIVEVPKFCLKTFLRSWTDY